MKKLRVGVWLHGKLGSNHGGAYGYYHELASALHVHSFKDAEIVFLSNGEVDSDEFEYKKILWKPRKTNILKFFLTLALGVHPIGKSFRKKLEESITEETNKLKNEVYQYADLIYYLTPSCVYPDVPYVYTLWDLGHYNSYAFPETTMNGNFELRESKHSLSCHKALMVFTESETGKKECEKYLHMNKERLRVLPIFPAGVVHPKHKSKKPEKMKENEFFIHYPAQYWAHKNHYNLLEAMPTVIKAFPEVRLVLTGSDTGNKEYIMRTISELKLEKNIIELGFVTTEEIRWLYENSHGLVFPTLLGPTNMPPVEAATLGCPVACTNLPGHIEQLSDYGYYFDGLNANDIAEKIIKMIRDKKSGVVKKYDAHFTIDATLKILDGAFSDLQKVRFCWDTAKADN